jgi:hypothetical protein
VVTADQIASMTIWLETNGFTVDSVSPSCGNRGTLLWQREQWTTLPNIPFVGIVLTMPNVFWPVFQAHPPLQHDLPALGAAVLQQWAWTRYRVRLCGIVIQHTFGGRLNHNPHLHLMVSAGGLNPDGLPPDCPRIAQ